MSALCLQYSMQSSLTAPSQLAVHPTAAPMNLASQGVLGSARSAFAHTLTSQACEKVKKGQRQKLR